MLRSELTELVFYAARASLRGLAPSQSPTIAGIIADNVGLLDDTGLGMLKHELEDATHPRGAFPIKTDREPWLKTLGAVTDEYRRRLPVQTWAFDGGAL
jgi:hypothetical protein